MNKIEQRFFNLLKQYCDTLIEYQIDDPKHDAFDGGILCPACMLIHGRCPDAIYPMMYMADKTGEEKYLLAAKKLFQWGKNMVTDDGSVYNDAQAAWNGITVFAAVSLSDALTKHGHLLDAATRQEWEDRLRGMGKWLYATMKMGMHTNINYFATNCCAMAILGKQFGEEKYLARAKELSDYCIRHITENGLLAGEGQPNDLTTEKGCKAIDVGGYNVEESLPSLCRYAWETGDERALAAYTRAYKAHLDYMLPDGAWDNSTGCRNFKWTYWGSRTSDGCQEALLRLGRTNPMFAEAALRNFEQYEKCTEQGLLFGGPDYAAHGERACTHHTFCHAKVLAAALDEGIGEFERMPLPSDDLLKTKYYPETDTWRVHVGKWIADVTAYDFNYAKGGHASGGTMSLLYHMDKGCVFATGAVDYSMIENHNQQLSLQKAQHRSVCLRVEKVVDGVRFGTQYDYTAQMTCEETKDGVMLTANTHLANENLETLTPCLLRYIFTKDSVRIEGNADQDCRLILPVVRDGAQVETSVGKIESARDTFNLNPGFVCKEYAVAPDKNGSFCVMIRIL